METNVYLGVDESKQKAGTKEKTPRKIDIDKIVGGINKGTQVIQAGAGFADSTRVLLGKPKPGSPAPVEVFVDDESGAKTGMSTTTKVLIGVGVVVLIGAIIYFVKKK